MTRQAHTRKRLPQRIAGRRSPWLCFILLALIPCYAHATFSEIRNKEMLARLETVSSVEGQKAFALLHTAKAHHRHGKYSLELKNLSQGLSLLNVYVTNKYKGEVLDTTIYRFEWQQLKEPLFAARLLLQAATAHENIPGQALVTIGALRTAHEALEAARGRTSIVDVSSRLRISEVTRLVSNKLIDIAYSLSKDYPALGLKELAFFHAERSRSRLLLDMIWINDRDFGSVSRHREHLRTKLVLALVEEIENRERTLVRNSNVYKSAIRDAKQRLNSKLSPKTLSDADYRIHWGSKVQEAQRASANWDMVAGKLGFGEAMLMYHITDISVYVFLIRRNADLYVMRIGRTPGEIYRLVMKLRAKLLNPGIRTWQPDAEQLYIKLIYPLQRHLRNIDRLIIVPHGILHVLPFAALVDPLDRTPLLERFVISYIPMANLIFYRNEATKSNQAAMVLGIEKFSSQPRLRYGETEARAVKQALGAQAELLLGSKGTATKADVLGALAQRKVLHFSTHGIFESGNPLMSNLTLKTVNGGDEPLYAFEILERDVAAQFVVLSACETSITDPEAIALNDELISLPWAFLITGAQNVIASLWAVDEAETSELMRELHQAQSGSHTSRIGSSLSKAMKARRKDRHPYYWAPFILIGLGR